MGKLLSKCVWFNLKKHVTVVEPSLRLYENQHGTPPILRIHNFVPNIYSTLNAPDRPTYVASHLWVRSRFICIHYVNFEFWERMSRRCDVVDEWKHSYRLIGNCRHYWVSNWQSRCNQNEHNIPNWRSGFFATIATTLWHNGVFRVSFYKKDLGHIKKNILLDQRHLTNLFYSKADRHLIWYLWTTKSLFTNLNDIVLNIFPCVMHSPIANIISTLLTSLACVWSSHSSRTFNIAVYHGLYQSSGVKYLASQLAATMSTKSHMLQYECHGITCFLLLRSAFNSSRVFAHVFWWTY